MTGAEIEGLASPDPVAPPRRIRARRVGRSPGSNDEGGRRSLESNDESDDDDGYDTKVFVDANGRKYDPGALAWRYLGLYMDCRVNGLNEFYSKEAASGSGGYFSGSGGYNRRRRAWGDERDGSDGSDGSGYFLGSSYDGNGRRRNLGGDDDSDDGDDGDSSSECRRRILWAAYIDPRYSGNNIEEYQLFDPTTNAWDDATCAKDKAFRRCARMDCHEDWSGFRLAGTYKTEDANGFVDELMGHEGYCLWHDAEGEYEMMESWMERWPTSCTQLKRPDKYGSTLYIHIHPLPEGNMTLGIYTDNRCTSISPTVDLTTYIRDLFYMYNGNYNKGQAVADKYRAAIDNWNERMSAFKVCRPCRAYDPTAGYDDYGYETRRLGSGDEDDGGGSGVWGRYDCRDGSGSTNANQCYKFEEGTGLEVAEVGDLHVASMQGSILRIRGSDGVVYGEGGYSSPMSGARVGTFAFLVATAFVVLAVLAFAAFRVFEMRQRRAPKGASKERLVKSGGGGKGGEGDAKSLDGAGRACTAVPVAGAGAGGASAAGTSNCSDKNPDASRRGSIKFDVSRPASDGTYDPPTGAVAEGKKGVEAISSENNVPPYTGAENARIDGILHSPVSQAVAAASPTETLPLGNDASLNTDISPAERTQAQQEGSWSAGAAAGSSYDPFGIVLEGKHGVESSLPAIHDPSDAGASSKPAAHSTIDSSSKQVVIPVSSPKAQFPGNDDAPVAILGPKDQARLEGSMGTSASIGKSVGVENAPLGSTLLAASTNNHNAPGVPRRISDPTNEATDSSNVRQANGAVVSTKDDPEKDEMPCLPMIQAARSFSVLSDHSSMSTVSTCASANEARSTTEYPNGNDAGASATLPKPNSASDIANALTPQNLQLADIEHALSTRDKNIGDRTIYTIQSDATPVVSNTSFESYTACEADEAESGYVLPFLETGGISNTAAGLTQSKKKEMDSQNVLAGSVIHGITRAKST